MIGSACDEHLCVEDLYKVKLTMNSMDSFTTEWDVTGPAKGYDIQTKYSRLISDCS